MSSLARSLLDLRSAESKLLFGGSPFSALEEFEVLRALELQQRHLASYLIAEGC